MFNISQFLNKIRGAQAKNVAKKSLVTDAVKRCTGIDIPLDAVEYGPGSIHLKGISNAVRSAIFIKKVQILDQINMHGAVSHVSDIK